MLIYSLAAQVVNSNTLYGPYAAPLTATSSATSNGSAMYVDQNMQYTQYLVPPQQYQSSPVSTNPRNDTLSPNDHQNGSTSPGKLDVRLSGHARAVSLPASVVIPSTGTNSDQVNEQYNVEQPMYALTLEASE